MSEEEAVTAAAEAKAKRAHQLAADIADLASDLSERLEEAYEVISAKDLHDLIVEHTEAKHPAYEIAYAAWQTMYPVAAMERGMPMERVIARLFREAPKLEDGKGKEIFGQAPAIPEVQIMLKAGGLVQGAMSVTPEGTLRTMFVSKDKDNRQVMVEQFFDVSDVAMVAVPRELPTLAAPRRIITQ